MSAGSSSLMLRRSGSRRERRVDVQVRHLRERVHAGVGAAGSVQLELASRPSPSRTARSISPCTVRAFFWICQPL